VITLLLSIGAIGQQVNKPNQSSNTSGAIGQTDPALLNWEAKDKYFLVVTATKTGGQSTDLPYAKVDGKKVSTVLSGKGYKKIDTLTDKDATRENFVERLKQIRNLNDNSLVIVYYSGHGAPDPLGKDLWLQLYGQKYFGESHDLSVSELISTARAGIYKGELVVIIDACYSAQGVWTKSLNLSELENTLIFASSSRTQESLSVDISPTETMSAFTYYLIEGLTTDWGTVDENHDGIIRYDDLQTYIEAKLTELLIKDNQTDKEMTPEISGQQSKIWAAFDPGKAQNLKSLLRRSISPRTNILISQLPKVLQPNSPQGTKTPSVSPIARELAQRVPTDADPYTKALQAIAENRNSDALRLLEEAEKSNSAELTDIYQARGDARLYEGRFLEAKEWYEKALKISRKENTELLGDAGYIYLMLSDYPRAEELLKRSVEIRQKAGESSSDLVQDILGLSITLMAQGRFQESQFYLSRIQALDSKLINKLDPDISSVVRAMLMITSLATSDVVDVQKLAEDILASSESQPSKRDFGTGIALLFLSVFYSDSGEEAKRDETMDKFLTKLEQSIVDEDTDSIYFYTGFISGLQSSSKYLFGGIPRFASRVETICKRSLELLRRESGPNDPMVIAGLGNLAQVYVAQSRYMDAAPLFKQAIDLANKTLGEFNMFSPMLHSGLGNLYLKMRNYQDAEQSFKTAISIADKLPSQNNIYLIISLESLANFYKDRGQYDDAITDYLRAIAVQSSWVNGEAFSRSDIVNIAEIYLKQKKYAEAVELFNKALALTEKTLGPQHPKVASILVDLGIAYFSQQDLKNAEGSLARAVKILQSDPSSKDSYVYASSLIWIAETYNSQKKIADADSANKQAFSITINLPANQKDGVISTLVELAKVYRDQKRDGDAERLIQETLSFYRNPENIRPAVAVNLYISAGILSSLGKYDEAANLYLRAIEIDEKSFTNDDPEVATDLEALAEVYQLRGKYNEAIPPSIRAVSIREHSLDKSSLPLSVNRLGFLYLHLNKYAEAAPLFVRSRELLEKSSVINTTEITNCLVGLAVVDYAYQQDYTQAESLLKRALSLNENSTQSNALSVSDELRLLGNIYRFQKKFGEAERVLNQSREVVKKAFGSNQPREAQILFNLGLLYKAQNKETQAESAFKQALLVNSQLNRVNQSGLAEWLDYYAATLRYMRRDAEASVLEEYAKRVRDNLNMNSH
jgi:tetratricopeptide (TPR) repeat protein